MKEIRKLLLSFRYAFEGLQYAIATQRNMKLHFIVSFVVLVSAFGFKISNVEFLFVILSITLVIVTELMNTAIEKAVDLSMLERHPLAKIAKDVAAAAVLITAAFACTVGMIIFSAPLGRLLQDVWGWVIK